MKKNAVKESYCNHYHCIARVDAALGTLETARFTLEYDI